MLEELVGKRVRFVHSDDQYTKLKEGDLGTVRFVDDFGTVHVKWDNGSSLGLLPEFDVFDVVEGGGKMTNISLSELWQKASSILPGSLVGEDHDGQLVIYTGLMVDGDGDLVKFVDEFGGSDE